MDKTLEIELAQIRPKVLSTAQRFFRVSGLDGDPEDVVQDVLLRLWEARCRGDEIRNAEAWAMAITKNCCVSLWRKARKETVLPLRDEFVAGHTPSGKMEEKEVEASVTKALERIPSATLYLLRLRAKGLSLDEIAAVTGRPKGSIKSSISTARKEIMKTINPK
ncbi:MAG: RNA polymerase sigma factor [Bacteroidales bacterium]|nr:RNA polymerase sigma factor [Bacteroidales bacterium]